MAEIQPLNTEDNADEEEEVSRDSSKQCCSYCCCGRAGPQPKPTWGDRCAVIALVCLICSGIMFAVATYRLFYIGPLFHDVSGFRSKEALKAEHLRRQAANKEGRLMTLDSLPHSESFAQNMATQAQFPYFNFVQGFPTRDLFANMFRALKGWFGLKDPKFKPPVQGETIGILTYKEFGKKHFGIDFASPFFNQYFTSESIPSWEDNRNHNTGISMINAGMRASRAIGVEPIERMYPLEPRFAFDNDGLSKVAWDGFRYIGPLETKYASNGIYGIAVVESLMDKYNTSGEVLSILMTDSVFGAHLIFDSASETYSVDLSFMSKYVPLEGYAALGGTATFVEDGGKLRTTKLEYNGIVYTKFDVPEVDEDYEMRSTRSGWRYAEAAIIASLLSMTNLVMHVKDLHLEIAAAFQAITVNAFAERPTHPIRRLLDPFTHRSGQATNDNFRLLFDYHAADFSLAPLKDSEQLKLIDDSVTERPLNMASMDMENYGRLRNIDPLASTSEAITNSSRWGWRWHYRALTVQRLYEQLISCWLTAHFGSLEEADTAMAQDNLVQAWWNSMIEHMPSLRHAVQLNPDWAHDGKLTASTFTNVARTIMVWLSWIHEDVGHSAAAYVYNPVYTPMCVPADGVGVFRDGPHVACQRIYWVPLKSWTFNALAYRGFVFLHRAALMDEPPDFWFDGNAGAKQCFLDLQAALSQLGKTDVAFSECDKHGFYSCVERVETAVSS